MLRMREWRHFIVDFIFCRKVKGPSPLPFILGTCFHVQSKRVFFRDARKCCFRSREFTGEEKLEGRGGGKDAQKLNHFRKQGGRKSFPRKNHLPLYSECTAVGLASTVRATRCDSFGSCEYLPTKDRNARPFPFSNFDPCLRTNQSALCGLGGDQRKRGGERKGQEGTLKGPARIKKREERDQGQKRRGEETWINQWGGERKRNRMWWRTPLRWSTFKNRRRTVLPLKTLFLSPGRWGCVESGTIFHHHISSLSVSLIGLFPCALAQQPFCSSALFSSLSAQFCPTYVCLSRKRLQKICDLRSTVAQKDQGAFQHKCSWQKV